MNKRLKHITAILLMLTMAVSGSYVFAGTEAPSSDGENQAAIEVTEETAPPEEAVAPEEMVQPEEAVQPEENATDLAPVPEADATLENEDATPEVEEDPGNIVSAMGTEVITASTLTYNTTAKPGAVNISYSASSDYCLIQIAGVDTAGKLWVDITDADSDTTYTDVCVGKYTPSASDPNVGTIDYTGTRTGWLGSSQRSMVGVGGLDVAPGGGIYCIGIKSSKAGNISVQAYVYSYAVRSLPANLFMLTSGYKYSAQDASALYMIQPSKTGYIRVYLKDYGYSSSYGKVTLLNSGMRVISDALSYTEGSKYNYVAFGVKRGVTYYLNVTSTQGAYANQYVYGIQYKNFAATLRANTVKKKATNLKRKAKYITTAVPATGKAGSQWYKFKVPKKQATQINVSAINIKSGTMTATVYCGKKKVGTAKIRPGQVNTLKVTYSTSFGKAKKGTYYLKISKSAKANGQYAIRYVR